MSALAQPRLTKGGQPYLSNAPNKKAARVGDLLGRDAVPTLPIHHRETPKRKTSFWEYCSPGRRMPLG